MWLGISGGILMALLLFAGVKGALVIGILFVTVISWIPNHSASYLGAASAIQGRSGVGWGGGWWGCANRSGCWQCWAAGA